MKKFIPVVVAVAILGLTACAQTNGGPAEEQVAAGSGVVVEETTKTPVVEGETEIAALPSTMEETPSASGLMTCGPDFPGQQGLIALRGRFSSGNGICLLVAGIGATSGTACVGDKPHSDQPCRLVKVEWNGATAKVDTSSIKQNEFQGVDYNGKFTFQAAQPDGTFAGGSENWKWGFKRGTSSFQPLPPQFVEPSANLASADD